MGADRAAVIDLTAIRHAALVVLRWADRPHDRLTNDWTTLAHALSDLAALPPTGRRLGRAISALTHRDTSTEDLHRALSDLADALCLPRPRRTQRADQLRLDL